MAATSKLVDQYGRPIRYPRRKAINPVWQNHFYHGASQDTKTPYQSARLDDIDDLLPTYDWQILLTSSRRMFANFGPLRSASMQKSDNTVGDAYLPEFVQREKGARSVAWARTAREWLIDNWFNICDLRGAPYRFNRNLWLDSVAMDRDGDVFYLLTSHNQSGLPAIQHIPANRITTGHHNGTDGEPIPRGPYRGLVICNGVIKNRNGRSVAYRVKWGKDDDASSYEDISARDLRQIYDPEWHDQSRGIPAASHALRFVANSLQSHEWEHTALMMLSSIGLIERNALGLPDEDDPMNTLGEAESAPTGDPGLVQQTLEGGTIRYFSTNTPGAGLDTISHERPSEQWERFQDRTVRFLAAGLNWPHELIWKSDEVNGVTIRNIQERAARSIRDRQAILDPHAKAQVSYALTQAVRLRLLPEPPDRSDYWTWRFRHPKQISIDPGRDTMSEIAAIDANHTPLRAIVESRGMTIEEHFDAIIEDEVLYKQKREAAGLTSEDDGGTSSLDAMKAAVDSYGVAVRAGTITPQPDDEDHFRQMAGLPPLSSEARELWDEQGRTRQPVTLVQNGQRGAPIQRGAPPEMTPEDE